MKKNQKIQKKFIPNFKGCLPKPSPELNSNILNKL